MGISVHHKSCSNFKGKPRNMSIGYVMPIPGSNLKVNVVFYCSLNIFLRYKTWMSKDIHIITGRRSRICP